jgi:hypothetical protein
MPPETKEILQPTQEILASFQSTLETTHSLPEIHEQANQPRAINVAEMPGDSECIASAQANLRARKAGDVALGGTIETKAKPIRNIKEGLEWAVAGDEEGLEMIDSNIVKEMSEYLYKAGNVSTVRLGVDSQGRILQHGQLMQDVYRNGYQLASAHPVLEARSQAEGNNGARLEHLNEQGLLDNHTMVVFSRTSEGMSDKELDDLKFFSVTKSLSIQATGKGPDGLKTETAFVAGVPEEGAERTDQEVVETIYEHFGVDCRDKTAEEMVDMPLLIPNEYMKNGVVDIVKLYDDINGGTFYGQNAARQDYLEHKKFCEQREKNLESNKSAIRQQLIAENNRLDGSVDVSKRLAKVVQDKLVKMAMKDEDIDTRVFGAESAKHINQMRVLSARGDWEQAMRHTQLALSTAKGGSCPMALTSLMGNRGIETGDTVSQKDEYAWAGGKDKVKKGKCVNCHESDTEVGEESWCKSCISDHCG